MFQNFIVISIGISMAIAIGSFFWGVFLDSEKVTDKK